MLGAYTPDQGIHPNPPLSRDTHIAEQLPAACGDADENFAPVLGVALPFDHFELQKSIGYVTSCVVSKSLELLFCRHGPNSPLE